MKYSIIKKKIVPIVFKIIKIKYFKLNLLIKLSMIHKLSIFHLHKINFQFNYLMINKDIRLLWRESSLFLSFLIKMKVTQQLNKSWENKGLIGNISIKNLTFIRQLKYLNLIQKLNKYLYIYYTKVVISKDLFISYNYFLNILYNKKILNVDFFQINKVKQLTSNQNFSIIRSPFVYSKSKESFGLNNYNLIIRLNNFSNIVVMSYFLQIQSYYNKYDLPFFIKYLN